MIEMERIQNLNLELGQEADGKVEDDRMDGRGFTSNINQNCEGASPLLPACLHLSRTGAAPRGECKTSAPSIGIPCHHERESLEIKRRRWAFYKALTTRQDRAPLNSFPWKTSFANEYGWNNRHAANATYLEINVRATNQHQVDRQTDISGTEKM